MATYRIVCTEKAPAHKSPSHQHIVAVGTGTDPSHADKRWTVEEVVRAIDRGDRFYTQGVESGKVAYVEKVWCGHCSRYFVRSSPDAVRDDNLDNLRLCSW